MPTYTLSQKLRYYKSKYQNSRSVIKRRFYAMKVDMLLRMKDKMPLRKMRNKKLKTTYKRKFGTRRY